MAVSRIRSVWGLDPGPNLSNWKKIFPDLKRQGYSGLEINVCEVADQIPAVKQLAADNGLFCTAMTFSLWPNYTGPRPPGGGTADEHLAFYATQLQLAGQLGALKMNCQSGCDSWPVSESVRFYRGTFALDAAHDFAGRVVHETHRNRSLFSPYAADAILREVGPQLHVTADISHWTCVCERLLTHDDDRAVLARLVPHVRHVHARMGLTQGSQCPEPTNPVFAAERKFFEGFWRDCVDEHFRRNDGQALTFVPEYGPYPYHPFNSSKSFSDVCDEEGARLSGVFGARLEALAASGAAKP